MQIDWTTEPIPENVKKVYFSILNPIVQFFVKMDINPNWITLFGFLLSIVASVYMTLDQIRIAGVFMLLSGIFDNLDGSVARAGNRMTKFGALLDSTLDRYAEVLFFFAIGFHFIREGWYVTSVIIAFALGGSLIVSYVRARAEGLGFECKIGFMQRAARLILLGAGSLIHTYALVVVVYVIAIFSNMTAIQRILYVWKADITRETL